MGPSVKFVSRINGSFSKKNYESTRNLGARWAPISSWWPSATLLALRACLTSSFTPFGHSSRVTHADDKFTSVLEQVRFQEGGEQNFLFFLLYNLTYSLEFTMFSWHTHWNLQCLVTVDTMVGRDQTRTSFTNRGSISAPCTHYTYG